MDSKTSYLISQILKRRNDRLRGKPQTAKNQPQSSSLLMEKGNRPYSSPFETSNIKCLSPKVIQNTKSKLVPPLF